MPEERRLVSVLFADVVGSTMLGSRTDPEVLREQMTRYFERMKGVADTHGGTVEKFIGDAVMVVFGVPRMHDDDAERAVRCGLAMQESMAELNRELGTDLLLRVGINSGEAVVRSGDDGQFIVGDPVNVAARLQQGAEAGEVLVGPLTQQLTRAAIDYQPSQGLAAKGKTESILAFHAIRPKSAVPRQARGVAGLQAPLVGRERELRLLLDIFGRVVEDGQAHLFTLVGNAGVGKSRLIQEALTRIAADYSPTILQGRCLPYGKGITYWPLIEILHEDVGITMEDDRERALGKLDRRLASLVQEPEAQKALARRLAVVLGLEPADTAIAEVPSPQVPAELTWAIRRYLESIASRNPVVVVIDDLQWAEAAIVDLVSQVTHRARSVPVLWVCMARAEFMEQQPHWGAGRPNTSLITVSPLTPPETSTLISRLLEVEDIPPDLRQRLLDRSEGNPLFCEEFLRMLIDESRLVRVEDRWQAATDAIDVRVPETIQALLATRLDSLSATEKRTLEAASIVGERFFPGQVTALCVDLDVGGALDDLLGKGLIVEETTAGSAVGLRFKHLLLRDVAYGALAKKDRAELHERFAMYLESVTSDRGAEYAEIIAHHADLALSLSREMRLDEEVIASRARRALYWNLLLAERALTRGDWPQLADRISTAHSALAAGSGDAFDPDRLRLKLLEGQYFFGADRFSEAIAIAGDVAGEAARMERWDLAAASHLLTARIELRRDPHALLFSQHAAEAGRLCRLVGDQAGELEAEWLLVLDRLGGGEGKAAIDDAIRLAERGVQLNDKSQAARRFAIAAVFSVDSGLPQQASTCIAKAAALTEETGARLGSQLTGAQAVLDAALGNPERAVDRLQRAIAVAEEEGWGTVVLQRGQATLLISLRRFAEADPVLEDALKRSQESGELWNRAELSALRAVSAVAQGTLDTAEHYALQALTVAVPGDRSGLAESSWALAEVRAAQGRDLEAEAAYRRMLAVIARGPYWLAIQDAELSFARFLIERGRGAEALPLLDAIQAWLDAAGYAAGRAEIAELRDRMTKTTTIP